MPFAGEKVERLLDGVGFNCAVLSVDADKEVVSIRYDDGWVEEDVGFDEITRLDRCATTRAKFQALVSSRERAASSTCRICILLINLQTRKVGWVGGWSLYRAHRSYPYHRVAVPLCAARSLPARCVLAEYVS